MKIVRIDILRLLDQHPGLTMNRTGVELSGRWNSSYVRSSVDELIRAGLLSADTSGGRGFKITLTEAGRRALSESSKSEEVPV